MKGLLSALAGAADQLDFIPGFDPRKDQQGMISKLMSGGQKPTGQSYQPQLDALLSPAAAGPAPMNALQKRTAQGMPPARINPPNPADYLKSHSILDVLNPFYSTVNQDLDAAHRYRTDKANYEAQQAQMASQASDQQFLTNAQAGGFTPEQIARMNIARNHNSEEFGKNFAGNFGFNTATEGSVYSQFGNSPTKVEKTFTPVDPAKLAIDQQNANSAQLTAEAAMHRAQNPAAQTVVNNNLPTNKGETAFQTERGKAASAAMDAINKRGDAAATTIADADMMNSLIDQIDYTGFGSETLLNVQKLARMLGFDIGDDVPAKEAATRLTAKLGLALKSDLPGPMSDGDRQFLLSIPPNIATTRAGNKALVYMMRKRAQFAKDMQDSLNAAAPQSMQDYYAWERQFRANYPPLFDAASQRDMMVALGMAGS